MQEKKEKRVTFDAGDEEDSQEEEPAAAKRAKKTHKPPARMSTQGVPVYRAPGAPVNRAAADEVRIQCNGRMHM